MLSEVRTCSSGLVEAPKDRDATPPPLVSLGVATPHRDAWILPDHPSTIATKICVQIGEGEARQPSSPQGCNGTKVDTAERKPCWVRLNALPDAVNLSQIFCQSSPPIAFFSSVLAF